MPTISNCPTCKENFGFFRWKYECSHCKNIFCYNCLTKTEKKLCEQCNAKYKRRRAEEKAKYERNLANWIRGTKQEYLKGYTIIKELELVQCRNKCNSPAEVEKELKHKALLINANAYIKFFWDKKIEHHNEEYIAGYGHKGNPYYKTEHHTTQYFTGNAVAVIAKKKGSIRR